MDEPLSPASLKERVVAAEREAWLSASGMVHFKGENERPEILLVDDDPVEVAVLLRWLTQDEVYKVHVASDGAAAWRMIADNPLLFDLILSDKNMPRFSGVELLERVVAAGLHTPVLLMRYVWSRPAI